MSNLNPPGPPNPPKKVIELFPGRKKAAPPPRPTLSPEQTQAKLYKSVEETKALLGQIEHTIRHSMVEFEKRLDEHDSKLKNLQNILVEIVKTLAKKIRGIWD